LVELDRGLAHIAGTPEIRDVVISGGDPLFLPTDILGNVLDRLAAMQHVQVVRISTRVPIFLPQRITSRLVATLSKHRTLWINVHCNHPYELAPPAEAALGRLADAGIPLGCQSVLLAGVNDCPRVFLALVQKLVANRVRPYFVYHCDPVLGAGHFRTPVAKGIEIMEALRGHTSGFAVPLFVIDAAEGGGKVPVGPNYVLSSSDRALAIRNYAGQITTCVEPASYTAHDSTGCAFCQDATHARQWAVADLLEPTR
jgi:lysine 2,3-aminomutase